MESEVTWKVREVANLAKASIIASQNAVTVIDYKHKVLFKDVNKIFCSYEPSIATNEQYNEKFGCLFDPNGRV